MTDLIECSTVTGSNTIRGSLYLSVDQAAAHLAACSLLGIQAGFHVIGDAGLDAALDALDLAAKEVGEQRVRSAGHRLEHAEMADREAISRLARHAVTISAQPAFDAAWGGEGGLYQERLGRRHH
jgi:predicted amidohydrolase YtcJ